MRPAELFSSLVDLVLPAACGGCGAGGTLWCAACGATLGPPRSVAGVPPVLAAGRYSGSLRTALLAYKERGRRDLAAPLADLLAVPLAAARARTAPHAGARPRLPCAPARCGPSPPVAAGRPPGPRPHDGAAVVWLVPAPSRPAAARARGGDHVLRLCRLLAARDPGLRVAPALRLARHARDSVGLDAGQRRANLAGRLRVRSEALPPAGAPVLLVDDVVTTRTTLAACASALGTHAVRALGAVVLCDATQPQHRRCLYDTPFVIEL